MQYATFVFNRFKVHDSTHVWMLTIQKMSKKLLNYSNTSAKHQVACVLIYFNKCSMQLVSNSVLSTHIHMLKFKKMWEKSLTHFSINEKS
jgi:hypothetical protein